MSHKKHLFALISLIGVLSLAACSSSDDPPPVPATGAQGTVSSSAGGALDEYVALLFTPQGGGMATSAITDSNGVYMADLAAGTYDLSASRPGYEDFTQAGLVVTDGEIAALDFSMTPMAAGQYIGSTDCGVCHAATHDTFSRSAHPFKINKIEGGVEPTYPFTNITGALAMIFDDDTAMGDPGPGTDNTLSTPGSYNDVSYVIGGYGWKARFMDADGYIVTGSEVQYNHFTSGMSAYHDNEVDKPFNCGNCHTTGWKHTDPAINPDSQGGLAGIDGNWAEDGITCEACHGAGSTHAQTSMAADITRLAMPRTTTDFLAPDQGYGMPIACGECHTRDGERDYPSYVSAFDQARIDAGQPVLAQGGRIRASNSLIRHHEQYDEILGIDPSDPLLDSTRSAGFMSTHGDCGTCHNSHTTTVFQDMSGDAPGMFADCTQCHADKVITSGGMAGMDCKQCHMPLMAKSATFTFDPGPGDDRPQLGDVTSHIFAIDLTKDPATEQFTMDGSYAFPWVTGKWACQSCHSVSGPSFPIGFPSMMTIHD